VGSCTAFDFLSINDHHDPHDIRGAVSVLARRDSFVKHVDNQHVDVTKHAPLLQNLQHSKVTSSEQSWVEENAKVRCYVFFFGAYVSHPSVLDTSGTFININPCESELFNLRADNNVVCQFPFLFFYSYLWLGRGLDIIGEDNIGLKLVPMRHLRVLRTCPCTLATLASPGSARS
jgi:hypothetical protein